MRMIGLVSSSTRAPTPASAPGVDHWTNAPLGCPVAVYGLKFLTNVGSPDPVMTRQLWAAVRAPTLSTAAGLPAVKTVTRAAQVATVVRAATSCGWISTRSSAGSRAASRPLGGAGEAFPARTKGQSTGNGEHEDRANPHRYRIYHKPGPACSRGATTPPPSSSAPPKATGSGISSAAC